MIRFTAKLPKHFNADAFEAQFVVQMGNLVAEMGRDFNRTVQTWAERPTWTRDIQRTQVRLIGRWVTITSNDRPADANTIYRFITRGTSVRYATMSDDFIPKTAVRVLDAGSGRGGMLYVNRAIPRPGIKARQFEELVRDRKRPRFRALMQKAMRDGARQSGHKF